MPIEIKELHIKAIISDDKSTNTIDNKELKREKEKMKKEIIKECTEEIFQLIEEKNER